MTALSGFSAVADFSTTCSFGLASLSDFLSDLLSPTFSASGFISGFLVGFGVGLAVTSASFSPFAALLSSLVSNSIATLVPRSITIGSGEERFNNPHPRSATCAILEIVTPVFICFSNYSSTAEPDQESAGRLDKVNLVKPAEEIRPNTLATIS